MHWPNCLDTKKHGDTYNLMCSSARVVDEQKFFRRHSRRVRGQFTRHSKSESSYVHWGKSQVTGHENIIRCRYDHQTPPHSTIVVFSTSANDQQLTTQQSHLTLKCLAHLMALDKFSRSPMHEHRTSGVARCWGDDTVRSLLRITPI
ncbi:unnamed protein product, partial [Nesidiocoris tenuis]